MKSINDIILIIPARVNSSRIVKKMIRPIYNTNLFEITLKKALQSKIPIENIYAAVGDAELIQIAKNNKINIFYRSTKSINTDGFIINCEKTTEWFSDLSKTKKYFMIINACQPFLTVNTINNFIDYFLKSENKSLISVKLNKNYYWNSDKELNIDNFDTKNFDSFIFNTKYVKESYLASHSLQIGLLDDIKKKIWLGTFKKNDPELFLVEDEETFDIDYPWEFEMAKLKYEFYNSTNTFSLNLNPSDAS